MKFFKDILPNILKVILFVGLGVFFIWLSVKNLSRDDVKMIFESMKMVNNAEGWIFIGLSAIALISADIIRAMRIKLMLETNGYKPRLSVTFYSISVCCLANLALPRLGEILRCSFMQRYENVPFQKSLGIVILERTVDMVSWLVLLVVALLMNNGLLSNLIVNQETQMTLSEWFASKGMSFMGNYLLYVIAGIGIAVVAVIYFTRNYWKKNKVMVKISQFFIDIWKGFISIKDMPRPWYFIFLTVAVWFFYLLSTYLFFFSMPYLRGVGVGAAFTVLIFGTISFMITQGGLGSYPLIAAGIIVLYGVSYTQGLAAGWIGWILQTVVALIIGLLTFAIIPFYKRNNSEIVQENQ